MRGGGAQRGDVALARKVRLLRALARADGVEHCPLHQVDACAVARADPHIAPFGVRDDAGEIGLVVNDDPRQIPR